MIKNIVLKEILESLKEPRFVISWILLLVVVISSVFLLSQDYMIKKESNETIERSRQKFTSEFGNANRFNSVMYCIEPVQLTQMYFRGPGKSGEDKVFYLDHVKALLPPVDLISVFSLLLPLIVIVFTYNSISGEKAKGTLKLMHSMGISRTALLLGKLSGTMAIIVIPFLFVFLVGIFTGISLTGEMPDVDEWISFAMIAMALILYLAFFTALGLLISSSVNNSGTSVLILLFLWVFFAMVIPNLSPLISSQLRPLPSVHLTNIEYINVLNQERDHLIHQSRERLTKEISKKYIMPGSITNLSLLDQYENRVKEGVSAQAISEYMEKSSSEEAAIREEQTRKARRLLEEFQRKVEVQSEIAKNISLLSPTSSFTFFALAIATLDENAERHFAKEAEMYQEQLWDFLQDRMTKVTKETGEEAEWDAFIDLSEHPRFSYKPEGIATRVTNSLFYLGHLAIFALITMLLAIFIYIRYDIR